jgi:transposase, IS5 family
MDGRDVPWKTRCAGQNDALGRIVNEIEYLKASVRAKVEHPFRVIKLQFGFVKVRYRGASRARQVDEAII